MNNIDSSTFPDYIVKRNAIEASPTDLEAWNEVYATSGNE
jgi:hypothetical protein